MLILVKVFFSLKRIFYLYVGFFFFEYLSAAVWLYFLTIGEWYATLVFSAVMDWDSESVKSEDVPKQPGNNHGGEMKMQPSTPQGQTGVRLHEFVSKTVRTRLCESQSCLITTVFCTWAYFDVSAETDWSPCWEKFHAAQNKASFLVRNVSCVGH